MSFIVVDVESDGPIPNKYSMVCFGAVVLDEKLDKTFYAKTKPVSDKYDPEALAISGFAREDHLKFPEPVVVMYDFAEWIKENSKGHPIFISDNNGYDFAWINYYFHMYYGSNPFGYSSRRIGDLWGGFKNDPYIRWKHMRKTVHSHDPLADALGNAEALLEMCNKGLKIKLK